MRVVIVGWVDIDEFAIEVFEREGIPMAGRVTAGAFEGGDCYYLDDENLVIGVGNRLTPLGVERASEILAPHGINVIGIELHLKWNHLGIIFSMLAERWCLAVPEALPDSFMKMPYDRKFDIIEMTAENVMQVFVNVLALGSGKMLSFK